LIAGAENLTPRRIRQIVRQSLRLRQIDPAGAHVRLQTARLDASLRLAADRIEDGEPGAIDRLLRVLDRLDRYRNAAAAAQPFDEVAEGAALFDARLDERIRRAAEDKARAAAARGGRTAARRRAPRGLQFACNPLILLDRLKNPFPDISRSKGSVGRRGPGRRRARGAGRRRAADPRAGFNLPAIL
jgi:hypothetical protein